MSNIRCPENALIFECYLMIDVCSSLKKKKKIMHCRSTFEIIISSHELRFTCKLFVFFKIYNHEKSTNFIVPLPLT